MATKYYNVRQTGSAVVGFDEHGNRYLTIDVGDKITTVLMGEASAKELAVELLMPTSERCFLTGSFPDPTKPAAFPTHETGSDG